MLPPNVMLKDTIYHKSLPNTDNIMNLIHYFFFDAQFSDIDSLQLNHIVGSIEDVNNKILTYESMRLLFNWFRGQKTLTKHIIHIVGSNLSITNHASLVKVIKEVMKLLQHNNISNADTMVLKDYDIVKTVLDDIVKTVLDDDVGNEREKDISRIYDSVKNTDDKVRRMVYLLADNNHRIDRMKIYDDYKSIDDVI